MIIQQQKIAEIGKPVKLAKSHVMVLESLEKHPANAPAKPGTVTNTGKLRVSAYLTAAQRGLIDMTRTPSGHLKVTQSQAGRWQLAYHRINAKAKRR